MSESSEDVGARLKAAKQEAKQLKKQLEDVQGDVNDTTIQDFSAKEPGVVAKRMRLRKVLKGQMGKASAISLSGNSLLGGYQHNKLVIWDALTGLKTHMIEASSWLMDCAISPSGNHVCSGGLMMFVLSTM